MAASAMDAKECYAADMNPMMNEGGELIEVTNHVVLFADVLGQKDAIKRLQQLPGTPEEWEQYVRALKNSAGKVDGLRKLVRQYSEAYKRTQPPGLVEDLPPEQKSAFRRYRKTGLKIQSFCDTVVVYANLGTPDGAYLRVPPVYAIIAGACTFMLTSLAAKTAICGGIDIGIALELSEHDLYGPGAAGAYAMEQRADWPRIAVGESVVRYLQQAMDDPRHDVMADTNRDLARHTLKLLQQDEGGTWFLDFLGKSQRNLLGGLSDTALRDAVLAGFDWVKLEQVKFKQRAERNDGNTDRESAEARKLARRFSVLRDYFERRVPYWLSS